MPNSVSLTPHAHAGFETVLVGKEVLPDVTLTLGTWNLGYLHSYWMSFWS